jgi:mercuric ion binding protein
MLKNILIICSIALSHGLLAQNTKKETLVVQTKNTCDHCKVCESCGGLLETDLYYVRGIKEVTYNEEAMTTTVVYKPSVITPDEIRQEIAKLGFDADSVPADPAGYAKRDGCCKK